MSTIRATVGRGSPQGQSSPIVTIRAEAVSGSEVLIVNPLKELFHVLEMRDLKIVNVLMYDRFTFRALPGNIIPRHYAVVESRRGCNLESTMTALVKTECCHYSMIKM